MKRLLALAVAGMFVCASAGSALGAPLLYKNCTNLTRNTRTTSGKVGARDRTTSGDPVTTFKRSTKLYRVATSYNRGLDRDKAGVACEKA